MNAFSPCLAYSSLLYLIRKLENRPITNSKKLRIAIARDPAFCFLSRETIDSLSRNGQITYFSPVYGSDLPEADLVYIPGGYPELFARQLYRRKRLFGQLRNYIENWGQTAGRMWGDAPAFTLYNRTSWGNCL